MINLTNLTAFFTLNIFLFIMLRKDRVTKIRTKIQYMMIRNELTCCVFVLITLIPRSWHSIKTSKFSDFPVLSKTLIAIKICLTSFLSPVSIVPTNVILLPVSLVLETNCKAFIQSNIPFNFFCTLL